MHTFSTAADAMAASAHWLRIGQQVSTPQDAEQLRDILRYHEHAYYVLHSPLITDAEYDKLYKQLEAWEKLHPEFITPDSPTQRVGSSLNAAFATVQHMVPMLSLDNSYNEADLIDWDRRVRELSGRQEIVYSVEPKFDGASISVIYENDLLVRSATRGDGVQGDDITTNSRQIKNLPLRAPFSQWGLQSVEIRGEVMMTNKAFADFNAQLAAKGQALLANPRNAAAGTLRMKDPAEVGRRRLEAFLYHISYYTTLPPQANAQQPLPTTHSGMLALLQQAGFRSPAQEARTFVGIQGVIDWCRTYESLRDTLPYEIDGLVIKVDDLSLHDTLGMTTHHPRWAIAYKFKARQSTSVLRSVEFQVGRTGAITPVAKIDPVSIGGVTVSSISVHNEEYIREKDLMIGDTVVAERAGDVIPQIVRSIPEARTGTEQPILFPTHCPVCGSLLYKEPSEAVWRCINAECAAQVVERMIHFVSKDAMDIRSFGEQQVKKFYNDGLLQDIPGIYRLNYEAIGRLEGFGKKSLDNLRQAVESSKKQPLHRLIYALGIRHVGETTAKALAQRVSHLLDLQQLSIEQLMEIDDVGPKVAGSIHDFFSNPQNLEMLRQLEQIGLTLHRNDEAPVKGGLLNQQSFLFTGTLSLMKRSDAEAMVEKAGGTILNGVSSKLNYLVVGDDAGSKLEKAKKIPSIRILSEQDFLKLLAYDQKT
jgi:DNA ligase (NAD+)